MKTSRQNHLKVPIITFLVCVIQVNGDTLNITQHPQYPNVSTSASLTCHIPSFIGGAEWLVNGVALTICQSSICIPPSSTRYKYSANATAMTVEITSVDIALDDSTWKCSHNTGRDIGYSNFTVYQLPSDLDINGTNSSILYEGDKVNLSVSTDCIHPSGSAYYSVIWKYVQANSSAENTFGTNIIQTITSVGGCQNTYEDNLMFSLFLTNDMNKGNTTILISQVKMTFTMAGINFYATKSVAYTVTSDGTAAPANKTEEGTTTTTTITVTSSSLSSTSMSSTTSSATTDSKSTKPTTNGSTASATSSTFISTSPTIVLPFNDTNNTSTAISPTTVLPSNDTNNTSTSISPITVLPHNDTNNISTSRSPTGSTVSATSNSSALTSSTAVSPANNTSNASTAANPTTAEPTATNKTSTGNNRTKSNISDTDIKVIVPAVVVPCGLLIIGALVLIVVFCVSRKARKNVRESPDGMAIQDKGNNIDGWKQSLRHGKATDNLDTVYTTPDGFIIYSGPADVSTARSYKDKKYHGVTDQYSRSNPGKHHHQADYIPSTFTSARAYTHRGKNHHVVADQYSRPYPGNYGNQTAYFPSTYKSARTYAQKGKTYEGHQPVSNLMTTSRLAYGQPASSLMATSRLAYGQTAYYPQTGYYGQSGQDVYYSGGGKYSYGQRSSSHHDHNGRKQQREYYSQYEMADYGGNRAGYRHTKQNTVFYY